jgi:hypothetical protein
MYGFILIFRRVLLFLLLSVCAVFGEDAVFSQEFTSYLRACAQTPDEMALVERILDLNITTEEAILIVTKIPFISMSERKTLLELLHQRRRDFLKQVVSTDAEGKYGFVVLGDEGDRRLVLKRYLYSVVKTEDEYQIIKGLFNQRMNLSELFAHVDALAFFRPEELRLARRIVEGRLEAYYHSAENSTHIYAQHLEFSSVQTNGHERDLLVEDGVSGRYRHHLRSTDSSFGRDFYADIAVEAGNQPGRESDRALLESISLSWAGKKDHIMIGDIYEAWDPYVLNQGFRGAQYTRRYSSAVPGEFSVFGGIIEDFTIDPMGSDSMYTSVWGLSLLKDAGRDRNWQISWVYADEPDESGGRHSNVLAVSHNAPLGPDLDFSGSMAVSHGNRDGGAKDQTGGALDLAFYYDNPSISGEFSMARMSDDFFSIAGENNAGLLAMHGNTRRRERWGNYTLGVDYEQEYGNDADTVRAATSLRPYIMVGMGNFAGIRNLNIDYYYGENQEESADKWVLRESNTHRLGFLRAYHKLHIDGYHQYTRIYDKHISADFATEENTRLGLKGFWGSALGRPFTPGLFLLWEKRREQLGAAYDRQGIGMDLQSTFGPQSRFTADFMLWDNTGPLYFAQKAKTAGMTVYRTLSEEWDKTLRFDWRWEEQNLAGGLSHGSANRLTLAYSNNF